MIITSSGLNLLISSTSIIVPCLYCGLFLCLISHLNSESIIDVVIGLDQWTEIPTSGVLYDDLYFFATNTESSGEIYIYFLDIFFHKLYF